LFRLLGLRFFKLLFELVMPAGKGGGRRGGLAFRVTQASDN
jgi:hypothetical protein